MHSHLLSRVFLRVWPGFYQLIIYFFNHFRFRILENFVKKMISIRNIAEDILVNYVRYPIVLDICARMEVTVIKQ